MTALVEKALVDFDRLSDWMQTQDLPKDGFLSIAEMVTHYGKYSSRDLTSLQWYAVLACYKLGVILEGTHARACAGKADKAIGDQLHGLTVMLFNRAHRWIEQGIPTQA